jgi:hypothetical protein
LKDFVSLRAWLSFLVGPRRAEWMVNTWMSSYKEAYTDTELLAFVVE